MNYAPVQIPENWLHISLSELCSIQYGKALTASNRISAGSVPVFASSGQVGVHDEAMLGQKSIVIGRKGSVGSIHVTEGPFWCIDTAYYLDSLHQQVDLEYLAEYLRAANLSRLAITVGVPGLNRQDLARVPVSLPSLPEQQRITEVIREINSIGLIKTRVVQRFDDLIQARYHEQFRSYFSAHGLVDPARIGDYFESTQYGFSEAMGESGSHAALRMNSISATGWLDLSDLKYIDLTERDAAATQLRDGDVLFNRTNSRELVGKCAIWRDVPGQFSFASYLVRLRLKPELLPEFLWATLNSAYGKYRLFNAAKQAVSMANVSPTDLSRIRIPLPPLDEQQAFAQFVRAVETQRRQIVDSSIQFAKLQPALVAEALSGRLTAAWREQHATELETAARERDAALGSPKPRVQVRVEVHAPPERPTGFDRPRRQALIDQLSSFQHEVWNTLRHEWRGAVLADDPKVFEDFCTNPQTIWRLEGFDAGRDEVRRALEQLASMGLVRKMSMPRDNRVTDRVEYLTAFRPLREDEASSRVEKDTAGKDAERAGREIERRKQEGR